MLSDSNRQPVNAAIGSAIGQAGVTAEDERALIAALRSGDERVFMRLVEQYQPAMVRLAQMYVGDRAVAEEVAQEAWLSALKSLDRFEGRSSFKTWLFQILVNGAKSRGQRERRSVPFSALADSDDDGGAEPSVAPERFQPVGAAYPGGWVTVPQSWAATPDASLDSQETRERIMMAIARLPINQQTVIRMRDVEGYTADEASMLLGISAANQRVLLHRARSRVRQSLEDYFTED